MADNFPQQMKDWFQGSLHSANEWMDHKRQSLQAWMNSTQVRRNWCFATGLALLLLGVWMFVTFNDGKLDWPWKNYQGQLIFPWMNKSEAGITLICEDGGFHFVRFDQGWMGQIGQFLPFSSTEENHHLN